MTLLGLELRYWLAGASIAGAVACFVAAAVVDRRRDKRRRGKR